MVFFTKNDIIDFCIDVVEIIGRPIVNGANKIYDKVSNYRQKRKQKSYTQPIKDKINNNYESNKINGQDTNYYFNNSNW